MDKLFIFRAEWFDGVWWEPRKLKMIARTKEEVESFIGGLCKKEFRYKPTYIDKDTLEEVESFIDGLYKSTYIDKDTLKITVEEEITIPYVL